MFTILFQEASILLAEAPALWVLQLTSQRTLKLVKWFCKREFRIKLATPFTHDYQYVELINKIYFLNILGVRLSWLTTVYAVLMSLTK